VQRIHFLLLGLGGAVVLFLLSRTQRGQQVAGDTLEFADVAASRIGAALLSRGYRNNNPLNLRYIDPSRAFNGQVRNDGGYGVYDSMQNGVRAAGKQLKQYAARGMSTIRQIVSTWAPPAENDTQAYVADVSAQLDLDADESFDVVTQLADLAAAMARHENGYLDDSINWQWVYLA
jgi:BMFP domain-containing protein YqiC